MVVYVNSDGINVTRAQLSKCLQLLICSDDNNNHHCMPGWSKGSVALYFIATRELYSLYKLVNNNLTFCCYYLSILCNHCKQMLYTLRNIRKISTFSLNKRPTEFLQDGQASLLK